uniref:AAA domain protein n=1 Tax=Pseudomonas phage Pavpe01 TaxID=3138545 RepID=A0AAU6W009_9VIRU
MQARDLRPANQFAQQYGVKMLAYGPPGSGKTPLVNTAPRPVLLSLEPGMLSMRGSQVPTFQADTPAKIAEFFDWVFRSPEANSFDTVAIDSVSHMAEILLKAELPKHKNKLQAYGLMASTAYDHLEGLYYLRNKHTYLIAKQTQAEEEGVQVKRAYFPGQELNVKVPHLYDLIAQIAKAQIQGFAQPQLAIRCGATFGIHARDRTGKLFELEPPDLTALFNKAMSQ